MFHQRAGWYTRDRLVAIVENTIFRVADTGRRTGNIVIGGKAYQGAKSPERRAVSRTHCLELDPLHWPALTQTDGFDCAKGRGLCR